MASPRRTRQTTATFAVVVVVAAGLVGWSFLRGEPTDPQPPEPNDHRRVEAPAGPANTPAVTSELREHAAATPGAGGRDEPAAAAKTGSVDVRLRFTGPLPARARLFVIDDSGAVIAQAERRCEQREVAVDLTVPAHDWIRVGAVTFDSAEAGDEAIVSQVRTKLGPGERQLVVLECSGEVTTLRLVGPSARLLPCLTASLQRLPIVGRDPNQYFVRPSADGLMRCHLPDGPVRAFVVATEPATVLLASATAIDLTQRGGEIELAPVEPLLGIVVEQRGKPVPGTISLVKPVLDPRPSPCHVTTRRIGEAATFVQGWTEELGPFRVPIETVHRDGDLWVVEPRPEHRLGLLEVTIGERPEPSSRLDLLAEPLGGGTQEKLSTDGKTLRAVLTAGDYRLHWQLNGGPGPVAVEFVRLAAGEVTTLQLEPLVQQRWEVHLPVPPECKDALFLRLSGIYSLGGTRDGVLPIDVAVPLRVGDRGELIVFTHKATFAATVTAVDPGRRRAEITSTLTDARWTHLVAAPIAGGMTDIRLQQDAAAMSTLPAFLGRDALVPLLPGHPRDGCVVETIDSEVQLVRWFTVQAGDREVSLQGLGRWTTLTIERPIVHATIFMTGPGTADAMKVRFVKGAGPHRLFVADGTRFVHVDLEPGGRQTFDATLTAFAVRAADTK